MTPEKRKQATEKFLAEEGISAVDLNGLSAIPKTGTISHLIHDE